MDLLRIHRNQRCLQEWLKYCFKEFTVPIALKLYFNSSAEVGLLTPNRPNQEMFWSILKLVRDKLHVFQTEIRTLSHAAKTTNKSISRLRSAKMTEFSFKSHEKSFDF